MSDKTDIECAEELCRGLEDQFKVFVDKIKDQDNMINLLMKAVKNLQEELDEIKKDVYDVIDDDDNNDMGAPQISMFPSLADEYKDPNISL